MNKRLFHLLFCVVFSVSTFAQGSFLEHGSIGVNAGLYGYGGQVAVTLSPNFQARVGYDYLSYTYNNSIDFTTPALNQSGVEIGEDMDGEFTKAKLTFPNLKAMIDFYPMKNGVFSLTAGVYIGNNEITADGKILNYATRFPNCQFGFDDIYIQPDPDGSFDAKIKLGSTIKPYFGIGLGKTIPKSRVGFKFELGVVYQGEFKVESGNLSTTSSEVANNSLFDQFDDLPVSEDVFKLWPMMNFTLSYRIW